MNPSPFQPAEPDDLEAVASRNDAAELNAYLKTRRILIPRRPRRFLDAGTLTQEQLMEQIRRDARELNTAPFEPWILELDGMKRLPAFSNRQKMEIFSSTISQELNRVFSLAHASVLLSEITAQLDIDYVDLNLYSAKSWEIELKRHDA